MSTSPQLQIRLLGDFSITGTEEATARRLLAPQQRVLAYLLLQPNRRSARSQLAFRLWPESNENQAQTNLRVTLHKLNMQWPDCRHYLIVARDSIRWTPNVASALDVVNFEDALQNARQADNVVTRLSWLRQACHWYGGDLLPTIYDDWAQAERERLRHCYVVALEELIALLTQQCAWDEALHYARHLHHYDPLFEPAYRYLIELYTRRGDLANVLQTYQRRTLILQQELGTATGRLCHEPPTDATERVQISPYGYCLGAK